MRKRIIALLLALVMALGLVMPASATGIEPAGGDGGAPAASTPASADTPTGTDTSTPTGTDTSTPTGTPAGTDTPATTALTTPSEGDPPVTTGNSTPVTNVQYWDGSTTQTCPSATKVESTTTTLTGGTSATAPVWYVVSENVNINSMVAVTGHVNLILCNDKTLTVNDGACGIRIGDGTSAGAANLTIYQQPARTETTPGKLASNAGIQINDSSSLTVNSGTVTASGDSFGIWGNGTVTFNGGTLIASKGGGNVSAALVSTFTCNPSTYWWRTAAGTAQYKTQEWAYESQDLTGTYFEVTTTEQTNVAPNPAVAYLDWDGSKLVAKTGDNGITDYTVVSADSCNTSGNIILTGDTESSSPKWYVVKNNVTITGTMTITGDVNLLLCDGKTLTVQKGIVDGRSTGNNGNSLTIYGQPAETGKNPGKLVATGVEVTKDATSNDSVGISISTLTINGGEISATGGTVATGVSGMSVGVYVTNTLTVNGGKVEGAGGVAATSTGILCEKVMTVNGGEVTGTGSDTTETSINANIGVGTMLLVANGGKVEGIGGKATQMSCGIIPILAMSVNDSGGIASLLGNEEESAAVPASRPVIIGKGGEVTGKTNPLSIGILSICMSVDGLNLLSLYSRYDESGNGGSGSSTDAVSTPSAEIEAIGGKATLEGSEGMSMSCGILTLSMLVGVGEDDIADIMGGSSGPDERTPGGTEEEPDDDTSTTTGSTAKITATGADYGIWAAEKTELGGNMPVVWLNGGTLKATGVKGGITTNNPVYDVISSFGLDTFGRDIFGIDTYGNENDESAVTKIYVQKGTLIAEGTGAGGKGLDLGDLVSATVPLQCPAEYWWRINKAVNGYKKYPSTAYSYNGTDAYVEITSNGAGLPLLTDPDKTPLPEPDGPKHQPIRRQKNAVAALIPTKPEKTDVVSPETFDAGIALYVGLGVLSLTGSAAWVGKRKKW